ncbi:MAG: putative Ig domain-containing protein, partial [Thiogranum sp.]|nr:putative Ig domain-containing protein [Thiogranum sp.]
MCNVRNSSKPSRSFLLLQCFLVAALVSACGGGGGNSDDPASVEISGNAIKGPVANATVTAHVAEADGGRGAALGAGTTDANGAYSITLDPASANAVLLVLTGGSYMDEASSNMINLNAGETLEAYIRMPSSGGITVNITALTSMAAGMVRNHIANGETLGVAINNAQQKIANMFEVGNVLYTLPPAPADLADASPQEINYSLISAGLSQLDFNDATRSMFEILTEITADIEADGVWGNGSAAYGPDDLLAAIAQFLANKPGITATVSPTVATALGATALDFNLASDNAAPVISGAPATTVAENAAYSFTPTASDADGDTLTFSITNKPAWATFDAATGALTGTPTNANVGTTSGIVITVDDQQGAPNSTASLAPFDLTVTNSNDAPIISGTPPTTVAQGALYTFAPTASDADGDTLTFSITNKPAWATFD